MKTVLNQKGYGVPRSELSEDQEAKLKETLTVKPNVVPDYDFGDILLFTGTVLNFVKRRVRIPAQEVVPVFPSIIQMKKLEILSLPKAMMQYGVKKVRRIGHSYEFEQIKNVKLIFIYFNC